LAAEGAKNAPGKANMAGCLMIRFVAIAAIGALSAVGAARAVVSLDPDRTPAPMRADQLLHPTATPSADASIRKAADGHYWAEGQVDGKAVRFLVDTGATAVSLTLEDARRLGIDPAGLNYAYEVITADGKARAAMVKLASVSIAGARIEHVDALIIEKGLTSSLLGMSYLGRLRSFEATQSALILKP
jgi:aspartyl protease family protein